MERQDSYHRFADTCVDGDSSNSSGTGVATAAARILSNKTHTQHLTGFNLSFHVAARRTFNVDPDTHIDSLEQAEQVTIEGTSKWSCKIAITGLRWSFAAPNRTFAILALLDRFSSPDF